MRALIVSVLIILMPSLANAASFPDDACAATPQELYEWAETVAETQAELDQLVLDLKSCGLSHDVLLVLLNNLSIAAARNAASLSVPYQAALIASSPANYCRKTASSSC